MTGIQEYFDKEKLKQVYAVLLEDRKKLVEKNLLMDMVIEIVERYFETGEIEDLTKIKKLIGDYCD
jgi:isochorismate synthase EntC